MLYRPNANGVGLAPYPRVADVDIVTARSEIGSGIETQCNVTRARVVISAPLPSAVFLGPGCVVLQRLQTRGRILEPGFVESERQKPVAVLDAGCIETERSKTSGVFDASIVVIERLNTRGRVVVARRVARERNNTGGRVGVAGRIVNERINPVAVLSWPLVLLKERIEPNGRVVAAGCEVEESLVPSAVLLFA